MTSAGKLTHSWSVTTLARLAGLAVPKETPQFFAWDQARRLYCVSKSGRLSEQEVLPFQPIGGAVSADGWTLALISASGQLLWRDIRDGSQKTFTLDCEPMALALEAFGQYLLISDTRRGVQLFTRRFDLVSRIRAPRPVAYLAFAHTAKIWYGAAVQGFVGAYDDQGAEIWKQCPMFECGGMALNSQGEVYLACHGGGIIPARHLSRTIVMPRSEPCVRLATSDQVSRFGCLLTAPGAPHSNLTLLDSAGTVLDTTSLPDVGLDLVLDPQGEELIVGLVDGRLLGLHFTISD